MLIFQCCRSYQSLGLSSPLELMFLFIGNHETVCRSSPLYAIIRRDEGMCGTVQVLAASERLNSPFILLLLVETYTIPKYLCVSKGIGISYWGEEFVGREGLRVQI